jgi:hypothetical protein
MNLRQAAALTLMGWYLMVPPYVWPYSQRDLRVPVSQWKLVQRFDTVTACEGYLQEMKEDPEGTSASFLSGGTQCRMPQCLPECSANITGRRGAEGFFGTS